MFLLKPDFSLYLFFIVSVCVHRDSVQLLFCPTGLLEGHEWVCKTGSDQQRALFHPAPHFISCFLGKNLSWGSIQCKNRMMKTAKHMVERPWAVPPASFSNPSFAVIKQALELSHLKRLTVEVWLLKRLLLSIAACQHQGCSEPRLSDIDESLQQIMVIVFHPFEMTDDRWAACSGSVYPKSKHD